MSAVGPAQQPTIVQRTLGVILRWGSWCAAGWFAYCFVVLAVEILFRHLVVPLWYVVELLFYNLTTGVVVAGILALMVFIPYAYAIAARPQMRFVGESLAWWTGLWRAALAGTVIAVVLGLTFHAPARPAVPAAGPSPAVRATK